MTLNKFWQEKKRLASPPSGGPMRTEKEKMLAGDRIEGDHWRVILTTDAAQTLKEMCFLAIKTARCFHLLLRLNLSP
jgi:hypothetical protein